MSAVTFDTHEFIKELKNAGFCEEPAEAITRLHKAAVATTREQARHDYELDNLVTNQSLDSRIREAELKNEVQLAETNSELVRWVSWGWFIANHADCGIVDDIDGHWSMKGAMAAAAQKS